MKSLSISQREHILYNGNYEKNVRELNQNILKNNKELINICEELDWEITAEN